MDSNWFSWITRKVFSAEIRRQVRACLSVETDATLTLGSRSGADSERDRFSADRESVQQQALEAWRLNPLARRAVELTSQYVVGGGIAVQCKHPTTARFIREFWEQRLNRMPVRVVEWCDELTRTGNLFVLVSTDAAGMSYVRAVPAGDIAEIKHRPNDVEQPLAFVPRATLDQPDPRPWQAYDPAADARNPDGSFPTVMLHYAVNRPVGAQWGEPDLGPALRWLSRYANWLEDRARLNRFRTAFLYVVQARFASEADRLARQQRLNASPPSPGSILVTDESEHWEVISPRLESADAGADGAALKKMIAVSAGVPLHFLAEPESATRTTAEAAGGPTYRRFEQRQAFFLWLIKDLLQVVLNRRALAEAGIPGRGKVDPKAALEVHGADLSARDNVALGMAANHIMAVLSELRDRGLIDDAELLRVAYRFCGEVVDVEDLLARGRAAVPPRGKDQPGKLIPPGKVDLETGEPVF